MSKTNHYISFLESLQKALGRVQEQNPGVIVISGPCEYFAHKALSAIKTVWKNKSSSSHMTWESDEIKKNNFVEMWEQGNLFEKSSLHLIRKIRKQTDISQWLSQLQSKPQNLIVLALEADKLTDKFLKAIEMHSGLLISCEKPSKSEIPNIANHLLKKRKLNLASDALQIVLNCVGEDLYSLENEIERLSLIFTDELPVKGSQIRPLMNSLSEEQSFKLVTLLINQETAQALMFIQDLLKQGESPIGIAALIAWHCRNALKSFESARSQNNTLKLSYYLVKGYQRYTQLVKPIQVIHALLQCQSIDSALKSSSRTAEDLLTSPILCLSKQI